MLRDDQVITLGQIHEARPWVWPCCGNNPLATFEATNVHCAGFRPTSALRFGEYA
jgi:hypothetical protein